MFKTLSTASALLGTWLAGGTLFPLVYGLTEAEGYHKREFDEALPLLSLLISLGIAFVVAAWFFWRASKRCATPMHH